MKNGETVVAAGSRLAPIGVSVDPELSVWALGEETKDDDGEAGVDLR